MDENGILSGDRWNVGRSGGMMTHELTSTPCESGGFFVWWVFYRVNLVKTRISDSGATKRHVSGARIFPAFAAKKRLKKSFDFVRDFGRRMRQ